MVAHIPVQVAARAGQAGVQAGTKGAQFVGKGARAGAKAGTKVARKSRQAAKHTGRNIKRGIRAGGKAPVRKALRVGGAKPTRVAGLRVGGASPTRVAGRNIGGATPRRAGVKAGHGQTGARQAGRQQRDMGKRARDLADRGDDRSRSRSAAAAPARQPAQDPAAQGDEAQGQGQQPNMAGGGALAAGATAGGAAVAAKVARSTVTLARRTAKRFRKVTNKMPGVKALRRTRNLVIILLVFLLLFSFASTLDTIDEDDQRQQQQDEEFLLQLAALCSGTGAVAPGTGNQATVPAPGEQRGNRPRTGGQSDPSPNDQTPTILGDAALTADQVRAWWNGETRPPLHNLSIPVVELIDLYASEGEAEGVRWDLAFAQAIHETGLFESGDTAINNFAGIGHPEGAARGTAFDSPEVGVRAHLQLLKRYSEGNDVGLARPDAGVDAPSGVAGQAQTFGEMAREWAPNTTDYWSQLSTVYAGIGGSSPSGSGTNPTGTGTGTNGAACQGFGGGAMVGCGGMDPAEVQRLTRDLEGQQPTDITPEAFHAYCSAATLFNLDWTLLAAIGWAECKHGRFSGAGCSGRGTVNSAGARGPMQFLGQTWRGSADGNFDPDVAGPPVCRRRGERPDLIPESNCERGSGYATDGDGDGIADPWVWPDATYSAARMLLANGVKEDPDRAIRRYNDSQRYVDDVRDMADQYSRATASLGGGAGGPERQAIIQRAYTWLNANCPGTPPTQVDYRTQSCGVPYSMSGSTYRGYRNDCSGFVSFAWNLRDPRVPAGADTTMLGSTFAVPITKEQLLPGDILLKPKAGAFGHVVLFEAWANQEHTELWVIEQVGGSIRETARRRVSYPYDGSGEYFPYRSRHLV